MISCPAAVVSFVRLEHLPASGANVSANDFFQSFKLGCEAAGAFVSEFLLTLISLRLDARSAEVGGHCFGGMPFALQPRCSAVDKHLSATTDVKKFQLYFLKPCA